MTLRHRLDLLAVRARPARPVVNPEAVYGRLCAILERHAPVPAAAMHLTGLARLDAMLDYLAECGMAIPDRRASRMARFAAVFGWTAAEFREALRERANGGGQ